MYITSRFLLFALLAFMGNSSYTGCNKYGHSCYGGHGYVLDSPAPTSIPKDERVIVLQIVLDKVGPGEELRYFMDDQSPSEESQFLEATPKRSVSKFIWAITRKEQLPARHGKHALPSYGGNHLNSVFPY